MKNEILQNSYDNFIEEKEFSSRDLLEFSRIIPSIDSVEISEESNSGFTIKSQNIEIIFEHFSWDWLRIITDYWDKKIILWIFWNFEVRWIDVTDLLWEDCYFNVFLDDEIVDESLWELKDIIENLKKLSYNQDSVDKKTLDWLNEYVKCLLEEIDYITIYNNWFKKYKFSKMSIKNKIKYLSGLNYSIS